jgi:predicted Fe-Mo cluster-binding NifX family protein
MNICIPVENELGLDSTVCAHFGSAPFFLMVDTETLECKSLPNNDQHHAHGMCHPVAALGGEQVDGIVVGGIGMGALNKLNAAGYQVFQSQYSTAKETVEAYKNGKLPGFSTRNVCGGHAHDCGTIGGH